MNTFKSILFSLLTLTAAVCRAADGGELLYWMVMSTDSITGTDREGAVFTAAELGVNGARVRYEGEDGSSGYLPIIGVYSNGGNTTFDGVSGALIPGMYYASLGSCADNAYSFVLELGNWSNGAWTGTSMESDAQRYDTLKNDLHIAKWQEDRVPSYAQAWMPSSFTVVPEPNSAILVLLGGAILALRRRPKVAV